MVAPASINATEVDGLPVLTRRQPGVVIGVAETTSPTVYVAEELRADGLEVCVDVRRGGQRLGRVKPRPYRQPRVVQVHRGAPGLRAGGNDISYWRPSQLLVGSS